MANMKPVKKFRSGNIEAAIWLNERDVDGNMINFKTVSLTRSWKKSEDDVWRNDVVHLRRTDLTKAILVLQKAQEDLFLAESVDEE